MLAPGQTLSLDVEKPAVGGAMIARVGGQIVLVGGAVPGERVVARIMRVGKGVAHAETISVEEASPDRVEPPTDPRCGGCLYAHMAYPRQLEIKSLVIADAFARIARTRIPSPVVVAPSPVAGYRMRARLHSRAGRLGLFLEGTHELCEIRGTGQLLPATNDVLDGFVRTLSGSAPAPQGDIEVAENVEASQRVVHVDMAIAAERQAELSSVPGLSGITTKGPGGDFVVIGGSPYVTDTIDMPQGQPLVLRRHVLAFFQGNRFLVQPLVAHVVAGVPAASRAIDLYAGGGLFALAAARAQGAEVIAVEGDRLAADDLAANAADIPGVQTVHQPVEAFVQATRVRADVVIVDPPRTGLSRQALDGVVRLSPQRLIYVSCDIATLARDARRLIDSGYEIARLEGFDMFPLTPHVEVVATFQK